MNIPAPTRIKSGMTVSSCQSLMDDTVEHLEEEVRALLLAGAGRKNVWDVIAVHPAFNVLLEQSAARRSRRAPDDDRTEEIKSEVRVILTYRFRSLDGAFPWKPQGPLLHWLSTVVSRACDEACRNLASQNTLSLDDLPDQGRNVSVEHDLEAAARLLEMITTLDEPERTVVYELWMGYNQTEIAQRHQFSSGWISELKKRAGRQLARYLGIGTSPSASVWREGQDG